MKKSRLEAFSDGVIAIIITIMVLELRAPHEVTWGALQPLSAKFFSYVLSYIFVGIYWNNHHHLFQAVSEVNGRVLWANLHLLFWLSLVPFSTSWMGENPLSADPVAFYGVVLLAAACAYTILTRSLIAHHGTDSHLGRAVGSDRKGYLSLALYAAALPAAYVHAGVSMALYVAVAVIWLVPDKRIERTLQEAR